MRNTVALLAAAALLGGLAAPSARAQRGMGDPGGVAQQLVKPKLVSLTGRVVAVETEPCEKTTGRGQVGTHLVLRTRKGDRLNVHLGWAVAVEPVARQLTPGTKVEITAFRTQKMPKGDYVAKSLTVDGRTLQLRDENLRPIWAGGSGRGFGRGWGVGPGRAWRGGRGGGWRGGRGGPYGGAWGGGWRNGRGGGYGGWR